jgi:hypothetical protein
VSRYRHYAASPEKPVVAHLRGGEYRVETDEWLLVVDSEPVVQTHGYRDQYSPPIGGGTGAEPPVGQEVLRATAQTIAEDLAARAGSPMPPGLEPELDFEGWGTIDIITMRWTWWSIRWGAVPDEDDATPASIRPLRVQQPWKGEDE